MKLLASLFCFLLISNTASAQAIEGSDCSARSAKLNPSERIRFMESCLAQAKEPANVQEKERKHKSAVCEQNSKNKKLQGSDKANYLSDCMNKNDAASAHAKNIVSPNHQSTTNQNLKKTQKKGITKKQALKLQKEQQKAQQKTPKKAEK